MTHEDDDEHIAITWGERIAAAGLCLAVCIALWLCSETGAMR